MTSTGNSLSENTTPDSAADLFIAQRTELQAVVARLRPEDHTHAAKTTQRFSALVESLRTDDAFRLRLQNALVDVLVHTQHIDLLVDGAMLPDRSFAAEFMRRITHKFLPAVSNPKSLRDTFNLILSGHHDGTWINHLSESQLAEGIEWLLPEPEIPKNGAGIPRTLAQLLDSLTILSLRLAASGTDDEFLRVDPALEGVASPFVAVDREFADWLRDLEKHYKDPRQALPDSAQLHVLIDQCTTLIGRIRRRAARNGASVRLTYLLQRQGWLLRRIHLLLQIAETYMRREPPSALALCLARLLRELALGEQSRNSLTQYMRATSSLVALRITDNAAKTGEHYITETRSDYFTMWRSALGAGPIIALMSMNKIALASQALPPLTETLFICLNYAMGFVIIHLLGFTVATKQPAMTAATIAGILSETSDRSRDLANMAALIARTVRSQLAAIAGNLGLAIPSALAFTWLYQRVTGKPFVSLDKADHMLGSLHPFASLTLAYAAMAGVCLYMAGIISGYYDNLASYNQVANRLRQHPWLIRHIPARNLDRLAAYVDQHLGALVGNFAFGFLLGGTSGLGSMLGLPLDIRHIAFASTYLGLVPSAYGYHPDVGPMLWAAAGVLLIGITNLAVSFALALRLALRARQVTHLPQSALIRELATQARHNPREFLFPPRKQP